MARGRDRSRSARRGLGAALLGLLLAGGLPAAAGAEDTVAFTIADRRITESSGLARDVANGLYWTVNDSGDGGTVYGLGDDGELRGTLNFRAQPTDVEAVAVDGSRLYVADIGDNDAVRSMVTVYFLTNPRANGLTVTYNAVDFRYEDGAHDAETLLVAPGGRLLVVTKGAKGGIYEAPQTPSRSSTNVLRRVGDAPALVTDGVVLPDGQIALLTYGSVEVLDGETYAPVSSTPIPAQPQAESLAVTLTGDGLLVGSEGRRSKVYALPLPGTAGDATPTPTAAPSASATPADSGEDPDAGAADAATPSAGRRGTLLAVGLAAVVAVVAGVVVAVVRKP
ncbi:hypothetical protein SAMN04488543_0625 [Friedmanniella luteola]|uniref:Uncharacterized protein n=1 Tax=Friedmanniella luteola TaxID=546871 RepID=A0A1H1MFP5_9ACTN|nr:hypothetical protein [Friedmanniella luteola]SDR85497.1 hypothetical protein SAMN04488543_0625 [Friedmanniella luteola]